MIYIIAAILIFGVLIAVHELGHFLAAKACGVRVNEFSIGMGPTILHKTKGDTTYSLRLLPIGGSVQIASPSERCLSALESLGLDALLSIEPPTAPWRGKVDQIRASLGSENAPTVHLDAKDQTLHVLNSHLTLSELSEENEEKFRNVTDCLKEELERQKDK